MLLVDGHNLMGRTPGLSLDREETSREDLLRRIAAFKGSGGQPVTVVFDGDRAGAAKEYRFGGIRVVYSPQGSTADDEILRLLGRGNPRAATVVTSDLRLSRRVRDRTARVESCESFLGRMERRHASKASEENKPQPGDDDVEEWLKVFGHGGKIPD